MSTNLQHQFKVNGMTSCLSHDRMMKVWHEKRAGKTLTVQDRAVSAQRRGGG